MAKQLAGSNVDGALARQNDSHTTQTAQLPSESFPNMKFCFYAASHTISADLWLIKLQAPEGSSLNGAPASQNDSHTPPAGQPPPESFPNTYFRFFCYISHDFSCFKVNQSEGSNVDGALASQNDSHTTQAGQIPSESFPNRYFLFLPPLK